MESIEHMNYRWVIRITYFQVKRVNATFKKSEFTILTVPTVVLIILV